LKPAPRLARGARMSILARRINASTNRPDIRPQPIRWRSSVANSLYIREESIYGLLGSLTAFVANSEARTDVGERQNGSALQSQGDQNSDADGELWHGVRPLRISGETCCATLPQKTPALRPDEERN